MAESNGHDIIALGASAGGVAALQRLVADLPAELPASVFVAIHLSPESVSVLPHLLDKAGPLPAATPLDGQEIRPGRIYVAPPDHHLLVREGRARISRGPRENRWRPAIDPLFRSAAAAYDGRVVAVVLTGLLDDGAAGLVTVQRCGGTTVVQDPDDAEWPDMPRSALAAVTPDHVVPLDEMADLLVRLAAEPAVRRPAPGDVLAEVRYLAPEGPPIEPGSPPGELTSLICPECGGPIYENSPGSGRAPFRCRVGHAFSACSMLEGQREATERALWAAMRSLEDRVNLLMRMSRSAANAGDQDRAIRYEERAAEARQHAGELRGLLGGRPAEAAESQAG